LKKMTEIKCHRFTVTVTGEREININLSGEAWEVSYDSGEPAGIIYQKFDGLEEAVTHARKLAGSKVV
jgi:hypothetical protein